LQTASRIAQAAVSAAGGSDSIDLYGRRFCFHHIIDAEQHTEHGAGVRWSVVSLAHTVHVAEITITKCVVVADRLLLKMALRHDHARLMQRNVSLVK
jgi:hypothetical protein